MAITFATEAAKLAQWDVYWIEFEQLSTTLTADLTAAGTAASAADISDLPNQGYFITEAGEIIEYDLKTFIPASAASGGTLRLVRRGTFDTTAASAASGETIAEPFMGSKFWTANHKDIGANDYPTLKIPRGLSQTLKSAEGQTSIGNMTFTITDKDDEFSKIAAIIPLRNKPVTLKAGFKNLDAADFEIEFRGLIRDAGLSNDQNQWKITVADLKRFMRKEIFTEIGFSNLAVAAASGDVVFTVNSTDGTTSGDKKFIDPADYPYGVYIKIDDEIIGPITSMTGTTLTTSGRGAFNTIQTAHDDDADVDQAFELGPANPVTLALQIILSTGTGDNHATYDVLPESMGFGAASAEVDIDSFEEQRDTFVTDTSFLFYIDDEINDGKTWMEKSILKSINSFIYVARDGRITFKVATPPIPTEDITVLDTGSIIGIPTFKADLPGIVNQIKMLYSKDPFDGAYIQTLLVIDADSISKHGASPQVTYELDGVHGAFSPMGDQGGDVVAESIGKYYRSRLANPQPSIKTKTSMLKRGLEVGSLVAVTHDKLPNWLPNKNDDLTGRGVIDSIMEVEKVDNQFDAATIDLSLIGTQYSSSRFAVIGPNGVPDYAAATELNRVYAYIAGADDGLMSNGDAPYLIFFGGGGATDTDIDFLSPILDSITEGFKSDDDDIFAEFHITTGHEHDGVDSRPVTTLPEDATFEGNLTVPEPGVMTTGCGCAGISGASMYIGRLM